MGFPDIFSSVTSYFSSSKQEADLGASLTKFKDYLNKKNDTIRIWTEAGPGRGHQSSTVNVLRQLVNPTSENGLAYAGTIELYYPDQATLDKLYDLLPALKTGKVVNATVNLILWDKKPPSSKVNLGFTGGADKEMDYAKSFNTKYFLRLQPFRWSAAEEIQFLDSRPTLVLTKQDLLYKESFAQRAYYIDQNIPVPDWNYYGSNGFKDQVEILQYLLGQTGSIDLSVVYSIRTLDMQILKSAGERMFNVITGMLATQRNGGSIRGGAKPIVIISCDDYRNVRNPLVEPLIAGGKTQYENANQVAKDRLEKAVKPDNRAINRLTQSLKPAGYRANYLKQVKAKDRVEFEWKPTKSKVQAKMSWLTTANDRILFIQLGKIPAPMFNYLMKQSAMPAVFEGQNTANVALQIGRPYYHVNGIISTNVQYPTTLLGYSEYDIYEDLSNIYVPIWYEPTIVRKMQDVANQINSKLEEWPQKTKDSPAEIMGAFVKNYQAEGSNGVYKKYYSSIQTFYQKIANDKLRVALGFMDYIIEGPTGSQLQAGAGERSLLLAEAKPLNDLLAKLYANLDEKGTLDLFPGVYSAGNIFDFISGLLGVKLSLEGTTIDPAEGTADPDTIKVSGNSADWMGIKLRLDIEFTAPESVVLSQWRFTYTGDWLTEQLPWFMFEEPYVQLTVADTLVPSSGGVGGILQGLDLPLDIRLPIDNGLWQLEGHFKKPYPSADKFFQAAGGINLANTLPSPFNALANIGASDVQLAYDSKANNIDYFSFQLASNSTVTLIEGLDLESITINVTVQEPGSLTERNTKWAIQGQFLIGEGEDAGVISTGMAYPGPALNGQLISGVIKVADLFNLFLPGTVFEPSSLPEVTAFNATFDGTTKNYAVQCDLNIDWSFVIFAGAPQITIDQVGVNVQRVDKNLIGGIAGSITLGTGATEFTIALAAAYDSTKGWTFAGTQSEDTPLNLTAISNQFLPSEWQITTQDYNIVGLGFALESTPKYFEVKGATEGGWTIPFLPGMPDISGNMLVGYGKQDKAEVGYYCAINATVNWIGIEMDVFFNYNPDVLSFGFIVGILEGKVEEKTVPNDTKKHWIGTLKFTDSTSLGSIIETMISWATGYSYGLAAPWDFLNSLALNKLELVYDFTAGTVSFKLDIGEINFGFGKVTGISVSYVTGEANPDDNGVMVSLDVQFVWQSQPEPLKWDAAKPETTPAPAGQGNAYFDLRLLALGQHVTIPGFTEVKSVQKAIEAMASLPDTDPDKVPAINFDPNSSWLVGMDFGILRLKEEKKSGGTDLMLAAAEGSNYMLDLQIVFNDPYLYGLRVALSGAPARAFAGLDFQIMYQKISDSVGVYRAEIALPDIMRKIQLGQVNITLPVFGIEVFTNGDFQVDIGFPWNADFSRSFTFQTIIWVGPVPIPIMGSAGLYFGKLSSATTNRVPAATNGTFNPVLVFGIGLQAGLGYDISVGILKAGFSLTVVAIIEGLLARFNPMDYETSSVGPKADISTSYYYWFKGTMGIQGKLFGYVDFVIIKAEVNLAISVLAHIIIEAYQPIQIGLVASVDVSVSVKINLGLFKIKISFSFSMTLKESFEIKVGSGSAPWQVSAPSSAAMPAARRSAAFLVLADTFNATPTWTNLSAPAATTALNGYIGMALTMAGDEATQLSEQLACYSAMLFIESVAAASEDQTSGAIKAAGAQADTSFESLAKQAFRWIVAAFQSETHTADEVDEIPIKSGELQLIYDYLSDTVDGDPISATDIEAFLNAQFVLTLSHPSTDAGEADATFFPIAPELKLDLPEYGTSPALSYSFADYNSLTSDYVKDLREYFDSLAVKMQEDAADDGSLLREAVTAEPSMATFIFKDYFLLIGRQMVQSAMDALQDFKYPIESGQSVGAIVDWVNTAGDFSGDELYTMADLFNSNGSHGLAADKVMKVVKAIYQTVAGDTFDSVSKKDIYQTSFDATTLATENAASTMVLQAGAVIEYTGKESYTVQNGNSLNDVAAEFSVNLSELLANTSILTQNGVIIPAAKLSLPDFNAKTIAGDTLLAFSSRLGIELAVLAEAPENLAVVDLFDGATPNLDITDLSQFKVGELLKEIQRSLGLQHLSGMTSRYYLSGLRLPTLDGITPNYPGMWVKGSEGNYSLPEQAGLFALTGQQFPIPTVEAEKPYDIAFKTPTELTWLTFAAGADKIQLTAESDDYARVKAVRDYATQTLLNTGLTRLGLGAMFESKLATYSFTTETAWQTGSSINFPYGGSAGESPAPVIWTLPAALASLPDTKTRKMNPRMKVEVGHYDPASRLMIPSAVSNYAWATQVEFTVQLIPPTADSPASLTTYEIVGASGNAAVTLERMVEQLGSNDSLINQLVLAFEPNSSEGNNPGLQSDPVEQLTFGIAQANLSTFTRPDTSAFRTAALLEEGQEETLLLNKPTEFISLLWQASITRAGGYFLYYFNGENEKGLPERIFDDKGQAKLSLVVLYSKATGEDEVASYMNAFVTGETIDTAQSVVYAQAAPNEQNIAFTSKDTLAKIGHQYFTNIGDIVEDNPSAALSQTVTISVPEGKYEVGEDGGGAAESLQAIADKFNTTVALIKEANPVITTWPDPLPLYFALRLPKLSLQATATLPTMGAIATYYGMDLTALANYNRSVDGLYVEGTVLSLRGGPTERTATVPAGVVALEASRPEPAEVPDLPTASNYGELFLQHNYSTLTFKIAGTDWFKPSNPSLPTGPTEHPADGNNGDKMRLAESSGLWNYKMSIPYSSFAQQENVQQLGMPGIKTSPYRGLGYLVQPDFKWLDIYGNELMTDLSQPPTAAGGIINKPAILTGYTDTLVGLSQWPSVSSSWLVEKGDNKALLKLPLTFDPTPYEGMITIKVTDTTTIEATFTQALKEDTAITLTNYQVSPNVTVETAQLSSDKMTVILGVSTLDEQETYTIAIGNIKAASGDLIFSGQGSFIPALPAENSTSLTMQAAQDFMVYEQLWYQLSDPNGIALRVTTSLVREAFELDAAQVLDLHTWIAAIYKFLKDRKAGLTTAAVPSSEQVISFSFAPSDVIPTQVLELNLAFGIERTGGAVQADFETSGGVKSVTTVIAPMNSSADGDTLGLEAFAEKFEEALSIAGVSQLKIAVGIDRDAAVQDSASGSVWAVRLGLTDTQPIAYKINSPGAPTLFAPRPVSNKLESRKDVNIYEYVTGKGIDFSKPTYSTDFSEIDLDNWVGTFFAAVDEVLTPEFTASIQLVDKKLSTTYLETIQDQKESLAQIAMELMVAVFEGETADPKDIRAAFYQDLLVRLSNLYAVNSGIQFDATVAADASTGTPPNLYGNFIQNTVLEGVIAAVDDLKTVQLFFSAALDERTAQETSSYTITAPLTITAAVLASDGQSVSLTVSDDIGYGTTKVEVSAQLKDKEGREIYGVLSQPVEKSYQSYNKADVLTIGAAKLDLENGTEQPLAFLLSAPGVVRGEDQAVLSKIDLNLSFSGTDIEHQIAPPINGFTPSSWLSFVQGATPTLEADLGGFSVPMFLRAFPENPALLTQVGKATNANPKELSEIMQWSYSFDYSESFHYPQDFLEFIVNFNVNITSLMAMRALPDAFAQLAEFVRVFPSVNKDLKDIVAQIDATAYHDTSAASEELFKNGGIALNSFVAMVGNIISGSASSGLRMNAAPAAKFTNESEPYPFKIREQGADLEGKDVQVVAIYGKPPTGIGTPTVDIEGYTRTVWPNEVVGANYSYYYLDTEGEPLSSAAAQVIPKRTVTLPGMDILARQDADTTVALTRNQDLIVGKTTNPDFVYTTGAISFSNALLPTIDSMVPIEIADLPANEGIPTKRSLLDQLTVLMATLLKDNIQPTLTFQMTCNYSYVGNNELSALEIPVLMQPSIKVDLATGLSTMLENWSDGITNWKETKKPNESNGAYLFDLTIFSNLTEKPMPLLRLQKLLLALVYIS